MRIQRRPRAPDEAIAILAGRQHGVVSRGQLLAEGFSRDAIGRRVRGGRLHPLHRGVYAVGHDHVSTEARWLAAVLACGVGAMLSHRAAAALWGLRSSWAHWVEVSTARSAHPVPGVIVHRPRSLPAGDRRIAAGIPVTSVARTLVDLADVVGPRVLRQVLEQAEVLRLDATPKPIHGRRGTGRLSRALAAHKPYVPLIRSELERRMLDLCRTARFPEPLVNTTIEGMEVDFAWPAQRVVVETDGWQVHGTRTSFAADRRRSAALALAGWTVIRFTWEDVTGTPGYVVATLRRLLR